ncbi:hypothetical protein [Pseudarthrobacter sp. S9]|uniref:hypothetical protein n=1 Tax=Pseudarthrobacter sp. S9 TaxID=3418421 RepID=UPI003D09153A
MPAARAVSFTLRRAALLVGILAVIAGFLGMHILSGSHSMHDGHGGSSTIAAGSHASPASTAAGHSALGSTTPGHHGTATSSGTPVPPSCLCPGDCTDKPAMHLGCIPAPAGASLSAPPPGTAPLQTRARTAVLTEQGSSYSYLPGTPTPSDLSISRT